MGLRSVGTKMQTNSHKPPVLAIDLGTNLGWALHSERGVESGVLHLTKNCKKGAFSKAGYARLYSFLACVYAKSKGFILAVEIPHCGKFLAANRILFGLLGVVEMFVQVHEVPVTEYRPTAIKKYWTGKGNADKKAMLEATKKRGFAIKDHNESDAAAMLHLHLGAKFENT